MNAVIQVQDLTKAYPGIRAVDQLSFEVYEGEVFGLLGPNGAGKTTTLACIEGLIKPEEGSVTVLGADPVTNPAHVKRALGVQLQNTSLLPELNALEQIELFMALYGKSPRRDEALALLDKVALSEKAKSLPAVLSGGQQQRLALALALVGDPQIVILDEPTAGLDPQARQRTWQMVRGLQEEGRTIILTTHHMEEAEALCQRVGVIDYGRLLALDTPTGLASRLEGLSRISVATELPLEAAKGLAGVRTAWREDKWLHLRSDDIPGTVAALHEAAAEHGVAVEQLSTHQPNLEEVFLDLTGRSIRE